MSIAESMPTKVDLRRRVLKAARLVPASEQLQRSSGICQHILKMELYSGVAGVAVYRAIPGEVQLEPLFSPLVAMGMQLYLPRVDSPQEMSFCAWNPGEPLQTWRMGLQQPAADAEAARPEQIQIFLVPGVAFDRQGGRLGRGAGYYDRTLPPFRPHARFVGVCFSWQLMEWVPSESWDCRMDLIVTEDGIIVPHQASSSRQEL